MFRFIATLITLTFMLSCAGDEGEITNPAASQAEIQELQATIDELTKDLINLKAGKPEGEITKDAAVLITTQPNQTTTNPDGGITITHPSNPVFDETVKVAKVNRIVFSSDGDIFSMKPNGSSKKNLTQHRGYDANPVWSIDTNQIAFTSDRSGNNYHELFVMDSDGRNVQQVTEWRGIGDFRPTWSPFGVHVLVENLNVRTPAWSPNLRYITYSDTRDGIVYDIYIVDTFNMKPVQITDTVGNDFRPAWSPDGRKIAYHSHVNGDDWEIYTINADGSRPMNLTQDPSNDQCPTWSPDGERIAFSSFRDWNWEIFVMNVDGSNQRNITKNGLADDIQPSWR